MLVTSVCALVGVLLYVNLDASIFIQFTVLIVASTIIQKIILGVIKSINEPSEVNDLDDYVIILKNDEVVLVFSGDSLDDCPDDLLLIEIAQSRAHSNCPFSFCRAKLRPNESRMIIGMDMDGLEKGLM
jgi:hypothetical protein